ncbi:unnamed protein product [Ceratitis capitata]|uniref:(Mediterranean fruit fly) hypothetical protein n=1 Tax=Ceratitis capitata TaxID=7213 RepID=A0A811U9C7_CERCA|nr:unnamed protein product [Ceratitis capitata]
MLLNICHSHFATIVVYAFSIICSVDDLHVGAAWRGQQFGQTRSIGQLTLSILAITSRYIVALPHDTKRMNAFI